MQKWAKNRQKKRAFREAIKLSETPDDTFKAKVYHALLSFALTDLVSACWRWVGLQCPTTLLIIKKIMSSSQSGISPGLARMGGRSHFDMASPHYSVSAVFGASQTSGVNTGPLHGPVSPDYGKIIWTTRRLSRLTLIQLLLEGATFSAFALLAIFVSPASSDLDGLPSHCASFLFAAPVAS